MTVFVLSRLHGVKAVVLTHIDTLIVHLIEKIASSRGYRTERPYTVHVGGRHGTCGARYGRTVLNSAGIVPCKVNLQFVVYFLAQVHTSLIAFYAGVDDNSLCVIVRQRCGVFQVALRTGHRYMMVMAESGTVDIVLPIVRFSIVIGIQCRIKFGYIVFLEFFSAAHDFLLQHDKVIGIHHFRCVFYKTYFYATVVCNGRLSSSAFFGGYDNYTVGTACSIDSCGGSIFQDVYGFNIIRIY